MSGDDATNARLTRELEKLERKNADLEKLNSFRAIVETAEEFTYLRTAGPRK